MIVYCVESDSSDDYDGMLKSAWKN